MFFGRILSILQQLRNFHRIFSLSW